MTADAYIQSVIDHVPRGLPLREQIAMELGSHIAERVAHGQPIDDVVRQLGDPLTLAESYLSAVPLKNARFWPRALAKIVDFAIACAGAGAVAVLLWSVVPPERGYFVPLLCILTFLALFPVYTAIAEYRAGQTVGKRLMGIRVVRESGARIGLGQALLRQLPFFAQFFWIDVIFALFTDRSQRAFEMLTKTRAVMIVLCFVLFAAPGAAQTARDSAADVGSPPGRLVDIGGRKLHLHCSGSRTPTVILESGASAFALDWALVQMDAAKTNRVCSYDRAGYGWSEPGKPERADRVAQDLHTLLQTAGEKPPFVLVGASRGGLYTRIYHRRYPDDVVGMVQVDPGHEAGLFTMLNGQPMMIASLTAEQFLASIPEGAPLRPPARSPQTGAPFDRLPADLYAARIEFERRLIAASETAAITRDIVVDMMTGEHAALAELLQAATGGDHPLGDLPVVVLTRGLDSSSGQRANHASLAPSRGAAAIR